MNKNVLLLSAAVGVVLIALLSQQGSLFEGADVSALNAIKSINPTYVPWARPLFQPPSTEVETFMFSLQAALGAGIIGFVWGRHLPHRKLSEQASTIPKR